MQQRKFNFLVVALLVVSGLLFVCGEARASLTSNCAFAYTVTPSPFPGPTVDNATYTYSFVKNPSDTCTIDYIDLGIPVEINLGAANTYTLPAGGNAYIKVTVDGIGVGGTVNQAGVGDAGTKFGNNDLTIRVVKVGSYSFPSNFTLGIKIMSQSPNTLGASTGPGLLKAGNGSNTQPISIPLPAVVAPVVIPPKPTASISASSTNVAYGECTTLNWGTTDALSAAISSIGSVALNGTQQICNLTTTTTFTITATGNGGTATNSVSVTVGTAPTPIISFSASPATVAPNDCTTLTWNVQNATAVVITPGIGPVASSGSQQTPPLKWTTTYTIVADGPGGTNTGTVKVTVIPLAPTTVSLEANPSNLISGTKPLCSILSWNAPAGTNVAISSEWAGTIASGLGATGSLPVCPDNTTTYTAIATNTGGSTSGTKTITVDAPVIQTSCMQIIKKPKDQSPACINVCFEIGGSKRLVSADLSLNANCDPPFTKIAVFGPDVPNPKLRVSSLQCAPCGIEGLDPNIDGKAPDCSGIDFATSGGVPPFDLNMGTYKETCEFVLDTIQPTGTTFDLGADPQFWNGAYYMNVAACPRGYVNCNGTCKTACP